MRIMTGDATNPCIGFIVSAAVKDTIRLEAEVIEAPLPWQHHRLIEAAMARAAELLRQFVRAYFPGIKDLQILELPRLHRHNMALARTLARFAGYARRQMVKPQLGPTDRVRSVTTKALQRLARTHPTAKRFVQRAWRRVEMPAREIELLNGSIVADAAFIKRAVMLKQVGLTDATEAKTVDNGF